MMKVVALTGAGISAESGIRTFRDSNGLWEGYDVTDVASPEGWAKDQALVLDFYNQRRKQALDAIPNNGHVALVELEKHFDVSVVTQNVDNLHEKAGSSHVIHLHGELFKSRSTVDESLIYDMKGWGLQEGDLCEKGSQLRPHIVWFGETVPMMDIAVELCMSADILIIVGTSLAVYPAAGLINYTKELIPKFIIDPNIPDVHGVANLTSVAQSASLGVPAIADRLIKTYMS